MRDPIFKGATRPALVWGVPIGAFILVGGSHFVVGMWCLALVGPYWLAVALSAAFLELLGLRLISRDDPHRVSQWLKWLSWLAYRRNSRTWGAHSLGPIDFKKRR